jgi:hypothetical protein
MIDFFVTALLLIAGAFIVSVCAWVYAEILTDNGMLLNRFYNFIDEHLPWWLAKPIITCVLCVGGQMALWLYLFLVWKFSELQYDLLHHIIFVSFTIFYIKIIDKSWQKN